jgi:hypothetical protein
MNTLRTIHGWLGVIILPWVLIMGFTGFYMNHSKLVLSLFPQTAFSESQFEGHSPPSPITEKIALNIAASIWPKQPVQSIRETTYHGWPSFQLKKPDGRIIVAIPTGHYYVKTRYIRQTFSPNGALLHEKFYWSRVLKELHETGWFGGGMGTWLADIFSFVLIGFGVSGLLMWSVPKIRRIRRF